MLSGRKSKEIPSTALPFQLPPRARTRLESSRCVVELVVVEWKFGSKLLGRGTAHTSMRTITKSARYCLDTVSIHEFRKLPRLYNKQSRSRFRQRLYHKINLWSPFRLHAKGFTNSVRRGTGPLVVTCQPTCAPVYLYATQCSDCSFVSRDST